MSDELPSPLQRSPVLVDDVDAFTERDSHTVVEGIHRTKYKDQYFSPYHFLATPTPERLRRRRKRKPRKLPYTFVRHRVEKTAKQEVFFDPRVKKSVKVDKSKWNTMTSVTIDPVSLNREEYIMNIEEFKPVKVLRRVYKPILRRFGRTIADEPDKGTGVGGYIIRFGDGHEYCVLPTYTLTMAKIVSYRPVKCFCKAISWIGGVD